MIFLNILWFFMTNKSISYLIGFLVTSISFFNFEINAGINKKDFKSKTVSELIDVLNDDELLEKKVMEKIDKKLMCKLQLYSFPQEVKQFKESLEMSSQYMRDIPDAMQQSIKQTEQLTINRLKEIDKYCNWQIRTKKF